MVRFFYTSLQLRIKSAGVIHYVNTGWNIFSLDKWYHVAASWGSNGMKLYVDGELIDTDPFTGSGNTSSDPLVIGNHKDVTRDYDYNGHLDDVRIWNVALDEATIKRWNDTKINSDHPNYTNLVAHYDFNSGTIGQTSGPVEDNQNNYNGTNYGAEWIENFDLHLATVFTVTNTDNSGQGSLKQSISDANNNPGLDNIYFNIPGPGPHLIQPQATLLPYIIDPLIIDGYTQPGASTNTNSINQGNNAVLKIIIDGSLIGSVNVGLRIDSGNSTIRGLVMRNWGRNCIYLVGGEGNVLEGNFFGTDVTGNDDLDLVNAQLYGIEIQNSSNNLIGGNKPEAANIIADFNYGFRILGSSSGNKISRNFVGVKASGSDVIKNGTGILLYNCGGNNIIGGNTINERNIISGNNTGIGIYSTENPEEDMGNQILGNFIGLDVTGDITLPNENSGIRLDQTSGNIIGGTSVSARNVISGNLDGIYMSYTNRNKIFNNFIGTDSSGMKNRGNSRDGIGSYRGLNHNRIGGLSPDSSNIISGNDRYGVFIRGDQTLPSTYNVILGNYIGTDVTGIDSLGNTEAGVGIVASDNIIGGPVAEARNIISGNDLYGIAIGSYGNNKIQGNYIGLAKNGIDTLANGDHGIRINQSPNNLIGGTEAGERNIISGNAESGIYIITAQSIGNEIIGNFIGTDKEGINKKHNKIGILIESFPSQTTIRNNVISGNDEEGIRLYYSANNNYIKGNLIGTDVTGRLGLGNGTSGITILQSKDNIIGGIVEIDRNIISANNVGVFLSGNGTTDNIIQNNYIGTNITGKDSLGNTSHGVHFGVESGASSSNTIGGKEQNAGNIIAFNGGKGILLESSLNNGVFSNSIFSNSDLGIDLKNDGVTTNDPGDGDSGPNYLQNFPEFTSASFIDGILTIAGSLNSTDNNPYRIEFFSNPTQDGSGFGEGRTFLGFVEVNTVANNVEFTEELSISEASCNNITATATDADSNTSEFSHYIVPTNTVAEVPVQPLDETTGEAPVTLTFDDVITPGTTSLETTDDGVPPPTGFQLGDSTLYYEITTTAVIDSADSIDLCISYDENNYGNEEAIRLFHLENGKWEDRTTCLDMDANTVCGRVASLSPFTVFEDVVNETPVVGEITAPIDPVAINTEITANAVFTDGDKFNIHNAEWDWGDSSTSEGIINESNGSGSVTGTHIYTSPGVYTVTLEVTDNVDEAVESTFQFVVIYDPEGGFVTGGGWIDSPEGAYTPDPTLTGKANFGFVSKYKNGANVPTGQTQFQFKVANLKFKSTSYQWLVVAGAKAKYKGDGTINNNGNYGFMLTATDGQVNGGGGVDKFRIKIWDKDDNDAIVYDNQMGDPDDGDATCEIGGGSIVVHKSGVEKESNLVGDLDQESIPTDYALYQNHPNPFNPTTTIRFALPETEKVRIEIYNAMGQKLSTVLDQQMPVGYHEVVFDAKGLPSGVYVYKIVAGDFSQIMKCLLLK